MVFLTISCIFKQCISQPSCRLITCLLAVGAQRWGLTAICSPLDLLLEPRSVVTTLQVSCNNSKKLNIDADFFPFRLAASLAFFPQIKLTSTTCTHLQKVTASEIITLSLWSHKQQCLTYLWGRWTSQSPPLRSSSPGLENSLTLGRWPTLRWERKILGGLVHPFSLRLWCGKI